MWPLAFQSTSGPSKSACSADRAAAVGRERLGLEAAVERRHAPARGAVPDVHARRSLEHELGPDAPGARDLAAHDRLAAGAGDGAARHAQRAHRRERLAAAARRHVSGDDLVQRLRGRGRGAKGAKDDGRGEEEARSARRSPRHRRAASPGASPAARGRSARRSVPSARRRGPRPSRTRAATPRRAAAPRPRPAAPEPPPRPPSPRLHARAIRFPGARGPARPRRRSRAAWPGARRA